MTIVDCYLVQEEKREWKTLTNSQASYRRKPVGQIFLFYKRSLDIILRYGNAKTAPSQFISEQA